MKNKNNDKVTLNPTSILSSLFSFSRFETRTLNAKKSENKELLKNKNDFQIPEKYKAKKYLFFSPEKIENRYDEILLANPNFTTWLWSSKETDRLILEYVKHDIPKETQVICSQNSYNRQPEVASLLIDTWEEMIGNFLKKGILNQSNSKKFKLLIHSFHACQKFGDVYKGVKSKFTFETLLDNNYKNENLEIVKKRFLKNLSRSILESLA